MNTRKLASLLVYTLSCSSIVDAQTAIVRDTIPSQEPHWYSGLTLPYLPRHVRESSVEDSPRLGSLLRAGKLYLSLDDAIALMVENNLDVELQRYSYPTADSDLLRAQGGGATRGLPLNVDRKSVV